MLKTLKNFQEKLKNEQTKLYSLYKIAEIYSSLLTTIYDSSAGDELGIETAMAIVDTLSISIEDVKNAHVSFMVDFEEFIDIYETFEGTP